MTPKQEAALRQAREALEIANSCVDGYYMEKGKTQLPEVESAIAAIDEALMSGTNGAHAPEVREQPAPVAEPHKQQEPVAWMHNMIEGVSITHEPLDLKRHPERWTPLYTSPAQRTWAGLTDEEIAQGNKESWVTEQAWQSAVWWAEAKLKEKNT